MSALATLVERLPDELRRRAFTHSSWVDERIQSYERLEFLGDCVLGLAVAEELYRRAPDVDEGRLAQQRAYVVSRPSCAIVARTLDLADAFERERERRGAEARIELSRNVLAALCESVIGAAFLHYGYRETADAVIEAFRERIEYAEQGFVDHKTELQERLARQGASVSYRLMEATGPAHRRSFTSAAMLGDELLGTGEGPSKKASEQAAAQEALLRVDREGRLCT
ncbi:MAG: ribonuclease [Gaiellales bacterium]|nr:ribonuclease [Gaiellales bacterium]